MLSPQVRQQADRAIVFARLYATPEAYKGHTVILGGEIVRLWNVSDATWLEVVQMPLDAQDQPILTAQSNGRFIVHYASYLDPLIYSAGRVVTIAGRVVGTYRDTASEYRDTVPSLSGIEIYLWPQTAGIEFYPSVGLWWEWDPWYGGPWLWPRHRHLWWHRWPHHHHRRHR